MKVTYITLLVAVAFANYPIVFLFTILVKRNGAKKIYNLDVDQKQLQREITNATYTTPIHAVILSLCLFSKIFSPYEAALTVLYTFLITFVWTEVWHYFSHRAMHTKHLLFIHREHHRSLTTGPWTAVSFSVLEKLVFSTGIVMPMSFLSSFVPLSFIGICLYYLFYFVTNVIGHSNIEIRSKGYTKSVMGKIINTPSYHAMHHARFVKNYGLITSVLDRLFNTLWRDYDEVHDRVSSSQPLKNHHERHGIESIHHNKDYHPTISTNHQARK